MNDTEDSRKRPASDEEEPEDEPASKKSAVTENNGETSGRPKRNTRK